MAGALYRDEGEEAFTLMHRFHDADDDERRWYTTVLSNADGTPDEAGARKLVAGLIDAYQQGEQVQRIERIDLRSADPDFHHRAAVRNFRLRREWVH